MEQGITDRGSRSPSHKTADEPADAKGRTVSHIPVPGQHGSLIIERGKNPFFVS